MQVCEADPSEGYFGLSAYDVNYDYGEGECPLPAPPHSYQRLRYLKDLNDYMYREENFRKCEDV